jgi:hypothetical protein
MGDRRVAPSFRRLLRDKNSSQWIGEQGQPVSDINQAKDFQGIEEIMSFCRKFGLHNQEIVLKLPDDKYDVVVDYRE